MKTRDIRVDRDPERVIGVNPDATHHVDQRVVRADAGAAAGEILDVALEHVDRKAGSAQEVRGEQSAERAADHDGAALGHRVASSVDRQYINIRHCPRKQAIQYPPTLEWCAISPPRR